MDAKIIYNLLSWDSINICCRELTDKMAKKRYEPECVVGLTKGGVVPARMVADYFGTGMDFIDVQYYDGINKRKKEPVIKGFNECFTNIKGKRILIVDDIWDTGGTMRAVLKLLSGEKVKTATLFWKEKSVGKPNFFAEVSRQGEWISFPWEKYEFDRERAKWTKSK